MMENPDISKSTEFEYSVSKLYFELCKKIGDMGR